MPYRKSVKTPAIEAYLEELAGRSTAIESGVCVKPPFGCGRPVHGFRNEDSEREFGISGLCQRCQDSVFGKGE